MLPTIGKREVNNAPKMSAPCKAAPHWCCAIRLGEPRLQGSSKHCLLPSLADSGLHAFRLFQQIKACVLLES